MADLSDICRVVGLSQKLIQIEVLDPTALKKGSAQPLTIGSYLKIADDDGLAVIAVIQAYRIKDPATLEGDVEPKLPTIVLDAQALGFLDANGEFKRGGQQLAIPPTRVELADRDTLAAIYSSVSSEGSLCLGSLSREASVNVPIDGNVFFGKHVAVVGSTGSGKSCAVAKIIQEGCKQSVDQRNRGVLNNAHIVVFDLHGEYATAFPNARVLDVSSLKIPYWLMTAEELEEIFIESSEQNSHNQISQFRYAVQENKRQHNPDHSVSYDSCVYFSIDEVYNYIANMNSEVIGKKENENCPKLSDETLITERTSRYFKEELVFVETSTAKGSKANRGPFAGDFDRFLLRLRTRIDSERMAFLFKPRKENGEPYITQDLDDLIARIIGYGENKSNITIIDLQGIPFEVRSLVVSLLSRIIFDVGFDLRRIRTPQSPAKQLAGEIAFLVVFEEAHKYVPNSDLTRYRSVTKSIERIAKEGRKYGVSLMIVSQRPSEISETVFSQCNSFVAMRLTNPADQNYVRRLLPDAVGGLTEALPSLVQREALVLGECISVPTLLKISEINQRPNSNDIFVMNEWRKDWSDIALKDIAEKNRN